MTGLYLDTLDELLATGLEDLSPRFVTAQISFVVARQQHDGGFCGRRGGADPYYTDFALRILSLLAPSHATMGLAAGYISRFTTAPQDVVECFSLLNSRRILRRCGLDPAGNPGVSIEVVLAHQAAAGGLARRAGETDTSAYATFVGALCCDCLHVPFPEVSQATQAIAGLARNDLGFAELSGQSEGQTNATAAALGFLRMQGATVEQAAIESGRFLRRMQCVEGGLKAHAAASGADLLSTFTGLLTLTMLGQTGDLDLGAMARFVRNCARHSGGFGACADDPEADVEYGYYGLGTMALLRLHGRARSRTAPVPGSA